MISPINKNLIIKCIVFIAILLLSSCANNKKEQNALVVTIEPQRYFLEQIVGDKFEVISLVPSGANPESFDPTPSQMLTLSKSKMYFKIGYLGVENTLIDKLKDQYDLNIVDCSAGIEILEHDCGDEDHDHGQHAHAHSHGDPHIWSSIKSARTIANNMYEAVTKLDSENKKYYQNNLNGLLNKINQTDSIIASNIEKASSKAFIIYHPALSYFAQENGLEQLSIEFEGKQPSPSKLKELIDKAKAEKVKAIFIQAEFDSKNAESIAKELGVTPHSINLLSYDWNEEMINISKILANE